MTKGDLKILREVIKHLEMNSCGFDRIGPSDPFDEGALPQSEGEVTEFIKKRTRLWRNSWVLAPLRDLVKKYEEKVRV